MRHPSLPACLAGLLLACIGLAVAEPPAAPATPATPAGTLALTFDDGLDPDTEPRATDWNRRLLDALDEGHVHAAVFPAGSKVGSQHGIALIAAWSARGHAVGNHTYSHVGLVKGGQSPAQFEADVERNEALFSPLPGWQRLLRFPFLKEGGTAAVRDEVRAWMRAHGYRGAPVSIDTSDWYYNQRFLALAPGDTARRDTLRRLYLAHLWDRANYYDGLAVAVLHRHPRHVMLLHTSALNAACLPDILAMFRSRGWTVVDALQAFDDPLYRMSPSHLPAGESILWALAQDAGVPGLRYPGEDDVYEMPILRRAGL